MATNASLQAQIISALEPLCEANQGRIDLAISEDDALRKLGTKPAGAWRIVMLWNGHGNHPDARYGMTNALFTTFIHQNIGMAHKIEGKLIHGDASFHARLDQVSKWMRSIRWPDGHNVAEEGLVLEDSNWVSDTHKSVLAHGLDWSLAYALDYQESLIVIPPDTPQPPHPHIIE